MVLWMGFWIRRSGCLGLGITMCGVSVVGAGLGFKGFELRVEGFNFELRF